MADSRSKDHEISKSLLELSTILISKISLEEFSYRVLENAERLAAIYAIAVDRMFAENEVQASEEKFRSLISTMNEGLCLHQIIYDNSQNAVDYQIIDVNPAYESIVGLAREKVIGKKASDIYGTGSPPYLEIYTKVAETRQPASFDTYFPPMDKHFSISVYSPRKGQFATIFSDISELKQLLSQKEALIGQESEL
jgi:PAS domain-containing protein